MSGGQSFTSASGSVGRALTVALVGAAIALGQGSVNPNVDGIVPLTGESSSVAAGIAFPDYSRAPTGSVATSGSGIVAPSLRPTDISLPAITGSSGVMVAQGSGVTVNITGEEAVFQDGILTGGTQEANGIASTTAQGDAGVSLTLPVSGVASNLEQGFIAVAQDAVDSLITSGIGIPIASVSASLSGQAVTTAVGDLTITGDSFAELTGVSSSVSVGSIGFEESYGITGSQITTAQQNVGAPGGVALTGAEVSVVAGDVFTTNDRTFTLTGELINAQDGISFASSLAFVIGQQLDVSAQDIGPRVVELVGSESVTVAGYISVPVVRQKHARGSIKRNYHYKGARYWLTNEELLRLISNDIETVKREDISVSYKDKKPHPISKAIWSEIKTEAASKDIQFPSEDEDLEAIIALL